MHLYLAPRIASLHTNRSRHRDARHSRGVRLLAGSVVLVVVAVAAAAAVATKRNVYLTVWHRLRAWAGFVRRFLLELLLLFVFCPVAGGCEPPFPAPLTGVAPSLPRIDREGYNIGTPSAIIGPISISTVTERLEYQRLACVRVRRRREHHLQLVISVDESRSVFLSMTCYLMKDWK